MLNQVQHDGRRSIHSRKSLKPGQFMCGGHPVDTLCQLNMRASGQRIRIIQCRGLNIDDIWQKFCVAKVKPCSTIPAKAAHRRTGRVEGFGFALRHCELALGKGRPSDHRRTCISPAIIAMTKRHMLRFAVHFIPHRAAVASSRKFHESLLCSDPYDIPKQRHAGSRRVAVSASVPHCQPAALNEAWTLKQRPVGSQGYDSPLHPHTTRYICSNRHSWQRSPVGRQHKHRRRSAPSRFYPLRQS
jgi:hypothetical protein